MTAQEMLSVIPKNVPLHATRVAGWDAFTLTWMRDTEDGRAFGRWLEFAAHNWHGIAAELGRLQKIIEQHDLCHDLDGTVSSRHFADGCAAKQREVYGCAPDADEVARLNRELDKWAETGQRILIALREVRDQAREIAERLKS